MARLRPRSLAAAALFTAVALFALIDVARPPERQHSAALVLAGIDVYQRTLSPAMPALGLTCRFTPTCSRYAEASIQELGVVSGSGYALRRIARCGPWTPAGTVDPPPTRSAHGGTPGLVRDSQPVPITARR